MQVSMLLARAWCLCKHESGARCTRASNLLAEASRAVWHATTPCVVTCWAVPPWVTCAQSTIGQLLAAWATARSTVQATQQREQCNACGTAHCTTEQPWCVLLTTLA